MLQLPQTNPRPASEENVHPWIFTSSTGRLPAARPHRDAPASRRLLSLPHAAGCGTRGEEEAKIEGPCIRASASATYSASIRLPRSLGCRPSSLRRNAGRIHMPGGEIGLKSTSFRIAVSGTSSNPSCRAMPRSKSPHGSTMNPRGISIKTTSAPIDRLVSMISWRFSRADARLWPRRKS